MRREEAIDRCAELNRNQGREPQWLARQVAADEWELIAVDGPELRGRDPLKEAVEARPGSSELAEPGSIIARDVPPYGSI